MDYSISDVQAMKSDSIHIGTSGWHYSHWKGIYYPLDMKETEWLSYYANQFQTVEINNTFYQLPETSKLRSWYDCVPDNFIFTVKASRYITHMKKLSDVKKSTDEFLKRVSVLKEKLGPILFQLPPNWQFNKDRLSSFLSSLNPEFKYAFEFRNESWHNDQTYDLLKSHHASFCIFDMAGHVSPRKITTDFAYIRLHGPLMTYSGTYSDADLSTWSENIMDYINRGLSVYCYFNNDQLAYAVKNAKTLLYKITQQIN